MFKLSSHFAWTGEEHNIQQHQHKRGRSNGQQQGKNGHNNSTKANLISLA